MVIKQVSLCKSLEVLNFSDVKLHGDSKSVENRQKILTFVLQMQFPILGKF